MNRKQRILSSVRLMLTLNAKDRVEYMRKHHLFGCLGKDVHIQSRLLPLYSNLIYIHNNVNIASNVTFLTHDIIHKMLNNKYHKEHFVEKVGCIEICDNVFIGAGAQIMYGTRIGRNVIIGAGSLVNTDVPDNCVYAGVPAKYIWGFYDYVQKARKYTKEFIAEYGTESVSNMSDDLAKKIYANFTKGKQNQL